MRRERERGNSTIDSLLLFLSLFTHTHIEVVCEKRLFPPLLFLPRPLLSFSSRLEFFHPPHPVLFSFQPQPFDHIESERKSSPRYYGFRRRTSEETEISQKILEEEKRGKKQEKNKNERKELI